MIKETGQGRRDSEQTVATSPAKRLFGARANRENGTPVDVIIEILC